MGLVKAKCTNCGGILSVDSSKDAAICPYCGTAYVVEKAIQNFTITQNVTNNIVADRVVLGRGVEIQKLVDYARKLYKRSGETGTYTEVLRIKAKLEKEYPYDYRSQLFWLIVATDDFDLSHAGEIHTNWEKSWDSILDLCDISPEERKVLEAKAFPFFEKNREPWETKERERLAAEAEKARLKKIEEEQTREKAIREREESDRRQKAEIKRLKRKLRMSAWLFVLLVPVFILLAALSAKASMVIPAIIFALLAVACIPMAFHRFDLYYEVSESLRIEPGSLNMVKKRYSLK